LSSRHSGNPGFAAKNAANPGLCSATPLGSPDFFDTLFPARNIGQSRGVFCRRLIYDGALGNHFDKVAAEKRRSFS
jgi:hypothetical protein